MDPIYESYQESVILEAFKSSLLTKVFKTAANKKKQAPYWDRDQADADGMMPDKNFMNRLKQDIGSMMRQLDLANVPDSAVIELPKDAFRKKANKKQYRSAIFVNDDYLPLFYASYFDDGTINYVSIIGEFRRRGEAEPKMSWVLSDDEVTKAIVVADYEKYFNTGTGKYRDRWKSKEDAVALMDASQVLAANAERYKAALAKKKSEDLNVNKVIDDLISALKDTAVAYGKMPMTADQFARYGDNKVLNFIDGIDKQIREVRKMLENIDDKFHTWMVPEKARVNAIIKNSEAWIRISKTFVESGELSKQMLEQINFLRNNQKKY